MSQLARTMTEQQLLDAIVQAAKLHGWMVAHFRPALTAKGWRTPMQGDPGFPDLVLARKGVVLLWELKAEAGAVSLAQGQWLTAINYAEPKGGYCGSEHRGRIVRPSDLNAALALLR